MCRDLSSQGVGQEGEDLVFDYGQCIAVCVASRFARKEPSRTTWMGLEADQ